MCKLLLFLFSLGTCELLKPCDQICTNILDTKGHICSCFKGFTSSFDNDEHCVVESSINPLLLVAKSHSVVVCFISCNTVLIGYNTDTYTWMCKPKLRKKFGG